MKMSRKRFIKILMSFDMRPREAKMYARLVVVYGSYVELAKAMCGI